MNFLKMFGIMLLVFLGLLVWVALVILVAYQTNSVIVVGVFMAVTAAAIASFALTKLGE